MGDRRKVGNWIRVCAYRFKTIGWLGILPPLLLALIIPLVMRNEVGAGQSVSSAYEWAMGTLENLNLVLGIVWPLLALKGYFKSSSKEYFFYLEEGWGLGKSLQICLSYALLTSLVFLYMVLVTGDQMGVDTYLRDYFALIAELVFIQGVFLFAAFAAESTLVAVIAVIGVNLSQWQSYPMDWIWLIFKQGSNYLSGNRHMPVKCGMILCGLLLLGATAWISKRKKF